MPGASYRCGGDMLPRYIFNIYTIKNIFILHIYYIYDIYNINMHIYIKREKNIDVKKEYWRQKKKIHILMQQCMSLIMTHIVKDVWVS